MDSVHPHLRWRQPKQSVVLPRPRQSQQNPSPETLLQTETTGAGQPLLQHLQVLPSMLYTIALVITGYFGWQLRVSLGGRSVGGLLPHVRGWRIAEPHDLLRPHGNGQRHTIRLPATGPRAGTGRTPAGAGGSLRFGWTHSHTNVGFMETHTQGSHGCSNTFHSASDWLYI